jgi:hypothetical protein
VAKMRFAVDIINRGREVKTFIHSWLEWLTNGRLARRR